MTQYFSCAKDHYVSQHRGEVLATGSVCPARDCSSRLRPATEESTTCPGCNRGLLILTEVDGVNVELCSFCGQSRLARNAEDVPAAKSGAERVAAHRARKRAAAASG